MDPTYNVMSGSSVLIHLYMYPVLGRGGITGHMWTVSVLTIDDGLISYLFDRFLGGSVDMVTGGK